MVQYVYKEKELGRQVMTEPVAYWHVANKNKKENYLEFGISDNKNFTSIPLYTKEQLHPRVTMTVLALRL